MEDVSIPVPGGEINVWHRPASASASTAVLVHGLSGTSRWWTRVLDHLPEDLGVVSLDIRGRGGSVDAPAPYDLATIADDIVRSLDHLDIGQAIVTGYSMGGWVVALFGVAYPERAERVLLVDGGFPLPRDPDTDIEDVIEAVVGPSLRRLEIEFESEEAFFDYWKAHPAFERHWDDSMRSALGYELVADNGRFRVRANAEAIEVSAREFVADPEANAASGKLEVPSHLIVVERGTMDEPGGMIPLQVAKEAASANPLLTMQYLLGVNHYTLILGEGARPLAAAVASE